MQCKDASLGCATCRSVVSLWTLSARHDTRRRMCGKCN